MDAPLEIDGVFTFSDTPSSIYDYECFDDQSCESWIKGQEFQKNEHHWNSEQKQVWHYFNRPDNRGRKIGPKQRREIKNKETVLEGLEEDRSLYLIARYLSFFILIATCIYSFFEGSWGILIIPLGFVLLVQLKLSDVENEISRANKIKQRYEKELNHLLVQHDEIIGNMISQKRVLGVFWKKIKSLENRLHLHHFGDEVKEDTSDFYERLNEELKEKKLDSHPKNPVILSWALLQPSSRSFDDKRQATGVKAARKEVDEKIATFRTMSDGTPLYRLLYVQFLFFKERNLNVVSLCHDFLTGEDYNVSVDTYKYNHITGTSYSQEDISYMHDQGQLEELNLKLPEYLLDRVYGSQVNVISFSSTSGTSFRCVLPDKKVTSGLDDWLLYKQQSLTTDELPNTELDDEVEYPMASGSQTSENEVLNRLADRSVKELWNRCDKSTALTEHGYLEDLIKERAKIRRGNRGNTNYRGRPPFAGKSQPRPTPTGQPSSNAS